MVLATMAARPGAAQLWGETLVDPQFIDCNPTPQNTYTSASADSRLGTGIGPGAFDIDGDTRVGPGAGPMSENGDGDAIYGTIADAVASTVTAGVVEITVPGVYRPSDTNPITITRSMRVRGPRDQDVIIAGLCPDTASTGITITGNQLSVVLENLTIRSFWVGVDMSACTECTVTLVNCRLLRNSQGVRAISVSGEPSVLVLKDSEVAESFDGVVLRNATARIHDSAIMRNGQGVGTCGSEVALGFYGSDVSHNLIDGVGMYSDCLLTQNFVSLTASKSRFVGNVDDGIDLSLAGTAGGFYAVHVSESVFADNGDDGLAILTNSGLPSLVSLSGNSFMGNGGDGIDTSAPGGGGAVTLSLFKNTIVHNLNGGVRNSGANTVFAPGVGSNSTCVNNFIGQNGVGGNFPGFGATPCGTSGGGAQADHESTF